MLTKPPPHIIEITHPSFPHDFAVRTVVRDGETRQNAALRAYTAYKVHCAFGDYRPISGNRLCFMD